MCTKGKMWFIGQFENGSYGFQQDGCLPRYTSKHEAECIKEMYEALKDLVSVCRDVSYTRSEISRASQVLSKAEGKED